MTIDDAAKRHIKALEADIEHYKSVADLLQEHVQELEDENRALRGQVKNLLTDTNYAAEVA